MPSSPLPMYSHNDNILLSMLRASLTGTAPAVRPSSKEDWDALLESAKRQGIIGILWHAVSAPFPSPENEAPSSSIPEWEFHARTSWQLIVQYIEQRNDLLNFTCSKVIRNFALENIRTCILKGQALGQLYPNPQWRQPGDVDVWIEGGKDFVLEYVKKYFSQPVENGPLHSSLTLKNGVELELHYAPVHSNMPSFNTILQKWFKEHAPWNTDSTGPFRPVSSPEAEHEWVLFNSVYLLTHIVTHMRAEGVGFKQILDLYWLMYRYDSPIEEIPAAILKPILPLYKALTWVFLQIGMPEEKLWIEPNERLGKLLLSEMLTTGVVTVADITTGKYSKPKVLKFFHRLKRSFRIMPLLGSEPFHKLKSQVLRGILSSTEKVL